MSENKTSKYFKYAIGEIILVVIGILIALQINNWNETRKDTIKERQLLDNLQIEFKDNLKELDSVAKNIDTVIAALEKIFHLFGSDTDTLSNDALNKLYSDALNSPNWRPSQYLLNNLNASGNIAELKNQDLKLLLYQWSRLQNEMHEVDVRTEKTGEEIISYLKQNGSLRNIDVASSEFNYTSSKLKIDNSNLLSDPVFENHIDDKLYMYDITKKTLGEARKLFIKLIEETRN
ncbi:DUF6090 family protein [Hanstruepera marina]|uniref:DUF6090 family protein n=1 Tax=Hanstruepera marina TaxID=2873265 RepID=UPI001CA6EF93|nr:DUF6090 family protein [Hanstruepera marina]